MKAPGVLITILALLIFVALAVAEIQGVSVIGYRVTAP